MNIELFSCAGGMAEGFRRAGIEFDFAFDFAADHCTSYEKNLGHRPVDVRDLLRLARAGMFGGTIDLFVADPPCTPWSRAGLRKGTEDERDMLEDTCELIRILRPATYLIGNVPGLDDSKNWHVVQRVIGGLQKYGYCVADFAALDAVFYGTPQRRTRPFWFGHLHGPCIRWPQPTHADPATLSSLTLPGIEPLIPWITCRQALSHLPPDEIGRPVRLRRRACNGKQHGSVHDAPARVVGTSNLSDGNVLLNDKHPPADPDKPAPAVTAKQRGPGGQLMRTSRERAPFDGGYTPSTFNMPAKAIVKNTHGDGAVPIYDMHHPPSDIDKPSNVVRAGDGRGANRSMRVRGSDIVDDPKHPPHEADEPAHLIRASDGKGSGSTLKIKGRARDRGRPGQGMRVGRADVPGKTVTSKAARVGAGESHVIEWPWEAPSTTVTKENRIPPRGHHPEEGSILSVEGAIVLSEKAAAILQGFPEDWVFEGKTQKARWSQIGQAMPPQLAHAVARAVAEQKAATEIPSEVPPSLATGKLTVV